MWTYLRDPFWCATATMTLHTAAYIAEILRGAIQAIPPGEIEAARALGMSKAKTLVYIILPRAARIGLPAYSNEVILMLKASSLASTVTLLELTGMARTIIARNYLTVEMFFTAGVFYLLISYLLVRGFKLLERWLRVDACQGR
jgi:polar amino acid transport system permease protein